MSKFVYIWEYAVADDNIERFIKAYGEKGDWVKLFSQDDAYIGTRLHRDLNNSNRFVTTDYWISKTANDLFLQKFVQEYKDIDRRLEELTESETFIGDFEIIDWDEVC